MTSSLALLAVAGLASAATAQGPTVTGRVFATTQSGHPMAVPGGFSTAARFDADHVLIRGSLTAYLSDGQTLRRIMVEGEQVPGQPAGVVWSARQDGWANIWPLESGGAQFLAYALGPGIGNAHTLVNVVGNPLEGPISLRVSNSTSPSTRSGLTYSWLSDLAVGPLHGEMTVRIPAGYIPPGFVRAPRSDTVARLNRHGAIAASYYDVGGLNANVVLYADESSIRTVAVGRTTLNTDRGSFMLRQYLGIGSAPLANGDVILGGTRTRDGQIRDVCWIAHASGENTVIAESGDRAPGTELGVTLQNVGAVAANDNGSVLLSAILQGPGITGDNASAYYLYRNGRMTLVTRSRAGAPHTFFSPSWKAVTLTADDHVGIIFYWHAVIYTPGIGTVTVAQRHQPLPAPLGLAGVPPQFTPFFGTVLGSQFGSSDEAQINHMTEAGELIIATNTSAGSSIFGLRVTDPGCPADFNLDGFTDFFDYSDFVECFEGGRCPDGKSPDFNNDDFDDFFDYSDFIAAFESPC